MPVAAKFLGTEPHAVPLLDDRLVEPGELVKFPGELVDDDPDAAADSLLIQREDGTRHALPFSMWEPQGSASGVKTIPMVLADVDGDPGKAKIALDAERARIKPRKSLVADLERISAMDPLGPDGAPAASELPKVPEQPSGAPDSTTVEA